jgi:four helix bundle protein
MKLSLKELRETKVWLQMSTRADLIKPALKVEPLINETNQLISIFVTSIKTAKRNIKKRNVE